MIETISAGALIFVALISLWYYLKRRKRLKAAKK